MEVLQQSIAQDNVEEIVSGSTTIPNCLENGLTPLQYAAENNSSNSVKLFLFQARMLNKEGKTALFMAARANAVDAVKILAEHESRLLVNGISALEVAAARGNIEVVKVMLEYEPERAKMAMFRARAKKQLETANWIKQWMIEQGSESGYNVESIVMGQTLEMNKIRQSTASVSPARPTEKSPTMLEEKSPSKTDSAEEGIISGIFSDEDSLEVNELAQSVIETKTADSEPVQSNVETTLCYASYDDPSELLQQRNEQLEAEFIECKEDYKKAVQTCTQYRDLTLEEQSELDDSKKQISCLKVQLEQYHKRFDEQEEEIIKCAAENEEMAIQLQECREQLIYKQNQLEYQSEEAGKKIENLEKELADRTTELEEAVHQTNSKMDEAKHFAELLDEQIHECDMWKERSIEAEKQSDVSLDEINKLESECAEEREILGQAAAENELAQEEIRELKALVDNEDVKYLMEQLEMKAEEVFVPTIRKLKDKMGV